MREITLLKVLKCTPRLSETQFLSRYGELSKHEELAYLPHKFQQSNFNCKLRESSGELRWETV